MGILEEKDIALGELIAKDTPDSTHDCDDRADKERTAVSAFPVQDDCERDPRTGRIIIKPCSDWTFENVAQEERPLFDSYSAEQVNRSGTEIEYYTRSIAKSLRDPLYDEPTATAYVGPYSLKALFERPDSLPGNQEQGFRTEWNGEMWLPRSSVELAGMKPPQEGDIVRAWNIPYFNAEAVDRLDLPNRGFYFDVEKVDEDGFIFDTFNFVGWKFELKRRTQFTPERRLIPE